MNELVIEVQDDTEYELDELDQVSTLDLARKYLELMALYNSTGEAKHKDLAERIEEELYKNGYQFT